MKYSNLSKLLVIFIFSLTPWVYMYAQGGNLVWANALIGIQSNIKGQHSITVDPNFGDVYTIKSIDP